MQDAAAKRLARKEVPRYDPIFARAAGGAGKVEREVRANKELYAAVENILAGITNNKSMAPACTPVVLSSTIVITDNILSACIVKLYAYHCLLEPSYDIP